MTLSGTPNIIWIKNIQPFAIVGTETLTPAFCKTCRTCGIEIKPLSGRREGWLCRKEAKGRMRILADYEGRLERAARESILPDEPDMERVEAFVEEMNRKALEV